MHCGLDSSNIDQMQVFLSKFQCSVFSRLERSNYELGGPLPKFAVGCLDVHTWASQIVELTPLSLFDLGWPNQDGISGLKKADPPISAMQSRNLTTHPHTQASSLSSLLRDPMANLCDHLLDKRAEELGQDLHDEGHGSQRWQVQQLTPKDAENNSSQHKKKQPPHA